MLISGAALALYGFVRLVFNAVGLRVFGAEYVGIVGAALSYASIASVLIAAVPSVLATRYIAQLRGSRETGRASRLFSGGVVSTAVIGTVAWLAFVALGKPSNHPVLAMYVPIFSMYLLLKGTYFAFDLHERYIRAELVGFAMFGCSFAMACVGHAPKAAALSMLAHPAGVVLLGLWDHRREWRGRGALSELERGAREYSTFAVSTMANALNGLGSYHLLLVLASLYLDSASTGYLSVLLSALSPFGLLPTAFGAAAYPELARRFGAGDLEGMSRLLRTSTFALQAAILTMVAPFWFASSSVLVALGLEPDRAIVLTWGWCLLSLSLNCISAPSGHYLNATKHIHAHAGLSVLTLVAGTWIGLVSIRHFGIIGAGLMRFAIDGIMAWARIGLAEKVAGWMRDGTAWLVVTHVSFLAIFVLAVLLGAIRPAVLLWLLTVTILLVNARRVLGRA